MSAEEIRAVIKDRKWKLELDELYNGAHAAVIYGPLYYPGDKRPKYGASSSSVSQDVAITKAFLQADVYAAVYGAQAEEVTV